MCTQIRHDFRIAPIVPFHSNRPILQPISQVGFSSVSSCNTNSNTLSIISHMFHSQKEGPTKGILRKQSSISDTKRKDAYGHPINYITMGYKVSFKDDISYKAECTYKLTSPTKKKACRCIII